VIRLIQQRFVMLAAMPRCAPLFFERARVFAFDL
jgi:hypothetical protein